MQQFGVLVHEFFFHDFPFKYLVVLTSQNDPTTMDKVAFLMQMIIFQVIDIFSQISRWRHLHQTLLVYFWIKIV